jgi:hypothetical protein
MLDSEALEKGVFVGNNYLCIVSASGVLDLALSQREINISLIGSNWDRKLYVLCKTLPTSASVAQERHC